MGCRWWRRCAAGGSSRERGAGFQTFVASRISHSHHRVELATCGVWREKTREVVGTNSKPRLGGVAGGLMWEASCRWLRRCVAGASSQTALSSTRSYTLNLIYVYTYIYDIYIYIYIYICIHMQHGPTQRNLARPLLNSYVEVKGLRRRRRQARLRCLRHGPTPSTFNPEPSTLTP